MKRYIKKTIASFLIAAFVLGGIGAAYVFKKCSYLNKLYCVMYGHDWERHCSDDWIWQYSYGKKSEEFPFGYKYRCKSDYIICRRSNSYLFSVPIVETDIYSIAKGESSAAGSSRSTDDQKELTLKKEWEYKNGKLDGLCREYYEDGRLRDQWYCKNDRMHGSAVFYHPNGIIRWEGQYINGRLDGVTREYFEDGTLKRKDTFCGGKDHGTDILNHRNGSIKWVRSYKNGLRDGPTREYYEDGKLFREGNFVKGNGYYKEYSSDGKLISEASYNKGMVTDSKR